MKYDLRLILAIILGGFVFLLVYFNAPKSNITNARFVNSLNKKLSPLININQQRSSQIIEIQQTIQRSFPCSNTDRTVNKANVPCEYMTKVENRLGIFYGDDDAYDGHLGMSKYELHLAHIYVNTIKLSITNALYIQFAGLIDGSAWPPSGQGQAITMTGIRRIDNLQMVLEDIIVRRLDGDFIELGVWKGGLCILATSLFHAYRQYNRKVYLADSFDGIPAVNVSAFPDDAAHQGAHTLEILTGKYTGGQAAVVKNFNFYFNVQSNRSKINSASFVNQIVTKLDPLESEFDVKIEFLKVRI